MTNLSQNHTTNNPTTADQNTDTPKNDYLNELWESISFSLLTEIPVAAYQFTTGVLVDFSIGVILQITKKDYTPPSVSQTLKKLALGVSFAIAKGIYVGFGKQTCYDLDYSKESCRTFEYTLGSTGSIFRKIARASIEGDTYTKIDIINEGINGLLHIADSNMTHIAEIESLSGFVTLGQEVWQNNLYRNDISPNFLHMNSLVLFESAKAVVDSEAIQYFNDNVYLPYKDALVDFLSKTAGLEQPKSQAEPLEDDLEISDQSAASMHYRRSHLEKLREVLILEYSCTSTHYHKVMGIYEIPHDPNNISAQLPPQDLA